MIDICKFCKSKKLLTEKVRAGDFIIHMGTCFYCGKTTLEEEAI